MAIDNRLPTGNGSLSEWDPVTNDYQQVDDPIGSPDDDASYISTSQNGADDLFTFAAFNIDAEDNIVDGVSVTFRSKIGTGGGPGDEVVRPSIKVNGTIYYGSGTAQLSSWLTSTFTWTNNPDTGAPWLDNDVNGIGSNPLQEFGVEYQIGSVSEIRCTQCYISASYVPDLIAVNSVHDIPVEWTVNVEFPHIIAVKWGPFFIEINSQHLIASEWLGTLKPTHGIPIEWSNVAGVISSHVIPIEWKLNIVQDDIESESLTPIEWIANLKFNYTVPIAWNFLIFSTHESPVEWLIKIKSINGISVEWHGFAVINSLYRISVEWKSNLVVNQILNPEWIFTVEQSLHVIPILWNAFTRIQPEAILNLEWGGIDFEDIIALGFKRYIDTTTGGGQTIYGVNGKFKVNPSTFSFRRRRGTNVIHLATAKPSMIELLRIFTSEIPGIKIQSGEFNYVSPSRMLRLTNMEEVSGITVDETGGDDFAIPITYIEKSDKFVVTNIHSAPEFTL